MSEMMAAQTGNNEDKWLNSIYPLIFQDICFGFQMRVKIKESRMTSSFEQLNKW